MKNINRYYTIPEYAKQFDISESFVRSLIKSENLPNGHQVLKLTDEKSAQARIWVSGDSSFKVQQLEKENSDLKQKLFQITNILLVAN